MKRSRGGTRTAKKAAWRPWISAAEVFRGFRGNARVYVLMEPMWSIPYNLYATYASVYMLELGCSSLQVGLIASISQACNMVFSLPAGHITDRLGRRRTTFIFDMLSWGGATLIWAVAGSVAAFVVAAIINSLVRIVHVSWSCMVAEDSDPEQRVHVYAWLNVAGILAGFVAPLAGVLVGRFGVVSSMRGLYLFAFVSMTVMFLIRNAATHEPAMGVARKQAVGRYPLDRVVADYRRVTRKILRSPGTLIAFALAILVNVQGSLRATFVAILLTRELGFPAGQIALFPAISSAVSLVVYLVAMPALGRGNPVRPLLGGFALLAVSALLLVLSPARNLFMVVASTVLGALGGAITGPFTDALLANSVSDEDRATSLAIAYTLLFGFSAPFGYLGGLLAMASGRLPLALTALTGVACVVLAMLMPRTRRLAA